MWMAVAFSRQTQMAGGETGYSFKNNFLFDLTFLTEIAKADDRVPYRQKIVIIIEKLK